MIIKEKIIQYRMLNLQDFGVYFILTIAPLTPTRE